MALATRRCSRVPPAEPEEPLDVLGVGRVPEQPMHREPLPGEEPAAELVVHLGARFGKRAELLVDDLRVGHVEQRHA